MTVTEFEREIEEEVDRITIKYDLDMPQEELKRITESAFSKILSDNLSVEDAVQFAIDNF